MTSVNSSKRAVASEISPSSKNSPSPLLSSNSTQSQKLKPQSMSMNHFGHVELIRIQLALSLSLTYSAAMENNSSAMKSRLALLKAVTIEEVDSKIEEEVDSREIEEAMETEIMMGLPEETSEIDLEAALIVENKAT